MNKNILLYSVSVILTGLLVFSCVSSKKSDPLSEFRESIKELNPRLMPASDVAILIEKSEAEYMPELTLSTSIIDKYMDGDSLEFLSNELHSAALMGIYTADVVYHLVFLNRDDAFESYTSAQLIANELGFGGIYVSNLLSRHESHDFSIDSMIVELDQALIEINEEYTQTDRIRILLVFMAANYIEKQYHIHATVNSYKTKEIDPEEKLLLAQEFIYVILSQEQSINTLIDLIEKNSYEEDTGYTLNELKELREIYSQISPLNEKIDELVAADIFENPDIYAMYIQLKKIRDYLTTGIDN
jgi:hypothetical protein